MKKTILMLIVVIFSFFNLDVHSTGSDAVRFKVVGMRTVLGMLENVDDFFMGTFFEDIRPTEMLSDRIRYDKHEEDQKLSAIESIKRNNPNNPMFRVILYQVKKNDSRYTFRFDSKSESDLSDEFKEITFFSTDKEVRTYAEKIMKKNNIISLKRPIKIYEIFDETKFKKLPKKILQETKDFVEAIVLINDCYMCIVFRKVYK